MTKNRIFLIGDWILIVMILILVLNTVASTIVNNFLNKTVDKKTQFNLSTASLSVNVLTGSLYAGGVVLTNKDTRKEIFSAEKLAVRSFSLLKLFLHDELRIGKIELIKGLLDTRKTRQYERGAISIQDRLKSLLRNSKLKLVMVNEIIIRESSMGLSDHPTGKFMFGEGDFFIYKLVINEQTPPGTDSIIAIIRNMELITNDSLYTIKVEQTNISPVLSEVKKIRVIPNYDKNKFSRVVGHQTDRLDLKVNSIHIEDFDIDQLIFEKVALVGKISIDSVEAGIYRDKYLIFPNQRKLRIRELLNSLSFALHVKKCEVTNTSITYTELVPPSKDAGVVALTNIDADIRNISNLDSLNILFSSTAMMGGNSPLILNLEFPDNSSAFQGSGYVKKLMMQNLSALFESTSNVTVTNGIIDSMHFTFNMNNDLINGTVLMLFHDFRVAAIDPETDDTTGLIKNLKTEIANRIVLKQSNLDLDGKDKTIRVERKYNDQRFILNNLVKVISEGINESVK